MLLSAAFSLALAQAGVQTDPETEGRLRAAPLLVALGFCSGQPGDEWAPAAADDPYVSGVRDYWEAAGKRSGATYQQLFFRGVDRDGKPNGAYLQHVMTGPSKAGQHSCIIHFPDRAPEGVGPEQMEIFAKSAPREKLILVLRNETTWEVTLPEGMGYDFLSVSTFAGASPARGAAPSHPFRGTQYRFLRLPGFSGPVVDEAVGSENGVGTE